MLRIIAEVVLNNQNSWISRKGAVCECWLGSLPATRRPFRAARQCLPVAWLVPNRAALLEGPWPGLRVLTGN